MYFIFDSFNEGCPSSEAVFQVSQGCYLFPCSSRHRLLTFVVYCKLLLEYIKKMKK